VTREGAAATPAPRSEVEVTLERYPLHAHCVPPVYALYTPYKTPMYPYMFPVYTLYAPNIPPI